MLSVTMSRLHTVCIFFLSFIHFFNLIMSVGEVSIEFITEISNRMVKFQRTVYTLIHHYTHISKGLFDDSHGCRNRLTLNKNIGTFFVEVVKIQRNHAIEHFQFNTDIFLKTFLPSQIWSSPIPS